MSQIAIRMITAVLAMVMMLGAPAFVQADPDKGMGHDSGSGYSHERSAHQFVGMIFHSLFHQSKELGFTDEQMNKLKALSTDYEKAKIRGEADLKLAEVDVQKLAHDDKADMGAIEAAVKKSEAAHAALRIEGIKTVRAAFAVLTPEQKEKMRTSRSMHGDGMKGEYDKHEGKPETPKGGMR